MNTTTEALDLDTLVENTTGTVVLKHPITGASTGASITIAGPEHPTRKAQVFSRMRQRRAELERTGRLTVPDPEDDDTDEAALLATCTLGWAGLAVAGQPLAYSAEAARALYADPRRRWVRDQVRAALDQRELFIGSSAPA